MEVQAQEEQKPSAGSAGVKEKVLKMGTLIDQSDDSELLPPSAVEVNNWLQNYHTVMGAMPEEAASAHSQKTDTDSQCRCEDLGPLGRVCGVAPRRGGDGIQLEYEYNGSMGMNGRFGKRRFTRGKCS